MGGSHGQKAYFEQYTDVSKPSVKSYTKDHIAIREILSQYLDMLDKNSLLPITESIDIIIFDEETQECNKITIKLKEVSQMCRWYKKREEQDAV
jgi:hypothetical protein